LVVKYAFDAIDLIRLTGLLGPAFDRLHRPVEDLVLRMKAAHTRHLSGAGPGRPRIACADLTQSELITQRISALYDYRVDPGRKERGSNPEELAGMFGLDAA
jgi:hypothetical protein